MNITDRQRVVAVAVFYIVSGVLELAFMGAVAGYVFWRMVS